MILYQITNLLNTSVVVEDIGVSLQSRGGTDSSRIITQNMFEASSDLKKMVQSRMVSVASKSSDTPRARRIPVWPLSLPTAPKEPVNVVPVTSSTELAAVTKSIGDLGNAVTEILARLKQGTPDSSISDVHHSNLESDTVTSIDNPVFIPKNIVPKAETNMSVTPVHVDAQNFEESRKNLKDFRRKK